MKFCMFLFLALNSSISQICASPSASIHNPTAIKKFKPYVYARYAWNSTNGSTKYQDYLLKAKFALTNLDAYKDFFAERENINASDLTITEVLVDKPTPGGYLYAAIPAAYTCVKRVLIANKKPYVFHNNELALYY